MHCFRIEVESLRVETNEHVSQLRWLEERLVTIEAEEKGIVSSMAEVRRINDIRMNSTQLDVFRLSGTPSFHIVLTCADNCASR